MTSRGASYTITGLDEWADATNATAFQRRLMRNIHRATQLNAMAAVKTMRGLIRGGSFARNAALTIAIKGSSKPLVDGGDLFQSISWQELGLDRFF